MSIQLEHVEKAFGHRRVLIDIQFELGPGDAILLTGTNGAGKTTLLRLLAGLLRPTSGRVLMDGMPASKVGNSMRKRIGYLSHQSMLYTDLTAIQNLRFYARMYGIPDRDKRIDHMLDWVGLAPRKHAVVADLSRGMRQRLAITRVLLHEPSVLLLDEPFAGLDQKAVATLSRFLSNWVENEGTGDRSLLYSSHSPENKGDFTHRQVHLERGRLIECRDYLMTLTKHGCV